MADQQNPEELKIFLETLKSINYEQERSIEFLKQQIEELKESSEIAKRVAEITNDQTSAREAQIKLVMKQQELEAAKILSQKNLNDLTEEELRIVTNIAKKVEESAKELRDIASAKQQGTQLANLLGFDEKNQNSLTYRILTEPKAVFQGFKDEIESTGGFIKSFSSTIITNIASQTLEAAKQYAAVSAEINKVTGAAGSLNRVLDSTARGATAFGINYEQAGSAISSLYANLNTFTEANENTQRSLSVSVAKLSQLGISGESSAKQIATLTQIMGISETVAARTAEELAGLAVVIGKTPQQVSQDFAQASDKLSGYGNNMVSVFKNLEIQSKATGLSFDKLLATTEQFMSFEGAATAAGKLNAALGGNFINSMELLEASAEDPSKAIDLLRQRFDEAGMSFADMNIFEQRMIADSLGVSIEEARRIMSQSNEERQKEIKAMTLQKDAQKELDNAIQKSIPVQQKFQLIMANLAIIVGPIVDKVSDLLSTVANFVDSLDSGTKTIISYSIAVGFLGFAVFKLFQGFKTLSTVSDSIKDIGENIKNTGDIAEKTTETTSEKIKNSSKNIGESIRNIAKSIGQSIKDFSKSLADSLVSIFKGIGNAFKELSKGLGAGLATLITSVLTALATGIGLIAATGPIGIVILGLLVVAFVAISYVITNIVKQLPAIITSFTQFFQLLMSAPQAAVQASFAFGLISGSIALLAYSMSLITNPLALAGFVALTFFINELKDSVKEVADSFTTLINAINSLAENKIVSLSVITKNMSDLATTSTEGMIVVGKQTKEIVEAINTFRLEDKQTANLEKILKALGNQQTTVQSTAAQQTSPVVNVYIGNEKLDSRIVKVVSKNLNQINNGTYIPASSLGNQGGNA